MTEQDKSQPESVGQAVRDGLVEEARTWLRWAIAGAVVGAAVLGGGGFYYLGLKGLAVGAAIGAIAGGVGAWLFYLKAMTF